MFKTDSLTAKVAELVAKSGPKVLEAIANDRAEKEFERRKLAAVKVVENLLTLEGNLKKLRPDNVSYTIDGDGKRVPQESWSKAKLDERDKTKEQIAKHEDALSKAIEGDDWEKLFNLANGKSVDEVKGNDQ